MKRWQVALGVCVGLLLPVPLWMLLSGVLEVERRPAGPPQAGRVSPVLSHEERASRMTYHRRCQRSADCEAPLGCLADLRVGSRYCTDSQCMTDAECPGGQVCQSLPTLGGASLVRFCVPVGVRQEGEQCFRPPNDRAVACGPGLLCSGHEGWCARPCRKEVPASCPEGFFCAEVAPEPSCLPTCEARGCPEGQRCIRFDEGVSVCARVYGPHCQQTPCPEGRECKVLEAPEHPGRVWMECVERCGPGRPACTQGLVCAGWHCLPPCEPQAPDACAEGYRCTQRRPSSPWVCEPDW